MPSSSGAEFAPVLLNPSEFLNPLGRLPFPNTLQPYIGAVLLEVFLYGIYSVLFSMCLYVLIQKRAAIHWILPVLTIVMFSIATADVAYTLFLHFRHALKATLTFHNIRPKYWLFVTNNSLADGTFLYRCYVVWGRDLRIVAVPALLFVASVVCGYVILSSPIPVVYDHSWKYIIITFILNLTLTVLTASRVWWISRRCKNVLDSRSRTRYSVALASVIESGLLVALYMIPEMVFTTMIMDNSFVQVVGIVPTLIIVQVGLGRANSNKPSGAQSTIHCVTERTKTKSHITFKPPNQPEGADTASILASAHQLRTNDHLITIGEAVGEKCGIIQEELRTQRGPEMV